MPACEQLLPQRASFWLFSSTGLRARDRRLCSSSCLRRVFEVSFALSPPSQLSKISTSSEEENTVLTDSVVTRRLGEKKKWWIKKVDLFVAVVVVTIVNVVVVVIVVVKAVFIVVVKAAVVVIVSRVTNATHELQLETFISPDTWRSSQHAINRTPIRCMIKQITKTFDSVFVLNRDHFLERLKDFDAELFFVSDAIFKQRLGVFNQLGNET